MERGMGFLADGTLNISQQCVLAANRDSCALVYIRTNTATEQGRGGESCLVLLCAVQPHLCKHCVQVLMPECKKDGMLLESIQRRTTKMLKGLEVKACVEQLRSLRLLSPEQWLREALWRLHTGSRRAVLSSAVCDRAQGNNMELCCGGASGC